MENFKPEIAEIILYGKDIQEVVDMRETSEEYRELAKSVLFDLCRNVLEVNLRMTKKHERNENQS